MTGLPSFLVFFSFCISIKLFNPHNDRLVPEPVTFENVIFESDIQVEIINDMEMSEVITLHGEQSFFGTLRCADISVDTLETGGTFNGHNLEDIFKNTFMVKSFCFSKEF